MTWATKALVNLLEVREKLESLGFIAAPLANRFDMMMFLLLLVSTLCVRSMPALLTRRVFCRVFVVAHVVMNLLTFLWVINRWALFRAVLTTAAVSKALAMIG